MSRVVIASLIHPIVPGSGRRRRRGQRGSFRLIDAKASPGRIVITTYQPADVSAPAST
jgi:hypothetical protein